MPVPASSNEDRGGYRVAHVGGDRRADVILAASHGGHLGQALRLQRDLGMPTAVVTTLEGESLLGSKRGWTIPKTGRIDEYLRNALRSLAIAVQIRPTLVVGFGAGSVAAFCFLSRILGARLVLVESLARVHTPSRSIRALSPFAHAIYVQWSPLKSRIRRAEVIQPIFRLRKPNASPVRTVLVTVGTYSKGMDRLLQLVDAAMPLPGNPRVVFQTGNSGYVPRHGEWFRFRKVDEFQELVNHADLIVTHDGSASIAQSLEQGKRLIVVPRTTGELDYITPQELATELGRRRWIVVAHNLIELRAALEDPLPLDPDVRFPGESAAVRIQHEYKASLQRRDQAASGACLDAR